MFMAKEDIVSTAVQQFGSPLFLYDIKRLREDYLNLRNNIPSSVRIYYSMKANPNPTICKKIHEMGSPIEIASIGEYHSLKRMYIPTNESIFTGPGKSRDEIRSCLKGGIGAINAESLQEIELIHEEAQHLGLVAPIMLRINLLTNKRGSRMASAGISSQFGIDEELLDEIAQRITSLGYLKLVGIHTYQGTQNFQLDSYKESVPRMFQICRELRDRFHFHMHMLGLGGGFGVPVFTDDEPFPISEFGELLAWQLRENEDLQLSDVFIESGRYLTARMGSYVSSVLYTKSSRGKAFAILDGGTHHKAFSTVMGRMFKPLLPVNIIREEGDRERQTLPEIPYTLVGKLCTPSDVLQGNVVTSEVQPGDIVAFPNSGAYGLTCGSVYFLSHPFPNEVMVDEQGRLTNIGLLVQDHIKPHFSDKR